MIEMVLTQVELPHLRYLRGLVCLGQGGHGRGDVASAQKQADPVGHLTCTRERGPASYLDIACA